jgi:GT2 family glycosyltransferase
LKLSIVIVNYNVKYFLEQCLISVARAIQDIAAEVFVVDNNSVDGSCQMVEEKFQWVKLIQNKTNTGFSKANNQAIEISTGEYVLLLNPDTVVEEDTFKKIIVFMESHPDAGGLGVHMIDGKGNFLPESKRGLPTPAVAFYKIFGFSTIFPKSKTFGRYHLGFLDKNKTHVVDVLSGAFMLIRKSVLNKIGLLDETFFMYGEDIDLSYRITQAGYKNYYFPETKIIHYKGESTKKSSVNYVIVFYKAMSIFAKKHFSNSNAAFFSTLINVAIYLRAALALFNRVFNKLLLPLLDGAFIYCGYYLIKTYWEQYVKQLHYPDQYMMLIVPGYVLIWLFASYLTGGYDRPLKISKTIKGILTGTIFILVVYALLNDEYRFSRALILINTAWACLITASLRYALNASGIKGYALAGDVRKKLIIVADAVDAKRILSLLQLSGSNTVFIGYVDTQSSIDDELKNFRLGTTAQLNEIIDIYTIDEVIFSSHSLTSHQIIENMLAPRSRPIEYKIAPPESLFIIGSNSINDNGELYLVDVNTLNSAANKRRKRAFDMGMSLLLLAFLPFLVFKVKQKTAFIRNCIDVLSGKKTWVAPESSQQPSERKNLMKGIFTPSDGISLSAEQSALRDRLNVLYTREYRIANDWNIVIKNIFR